jgi:hypothetical protein
VRPPRIRMRSMLIPFKPLPTITLASQTSGGLRPSTSRWLDIALALCTPPAPAQSEMPAHAQLAPRLRRKSGTCQSGFSPSVFAPLKLSLIRFLGRLCRAWFAWLLLRRRHARARLLLAALEVFPQRRCKPRLARGARIRFTTCRADLNHSAAQSMPRAGPQSAAGGTRLRGVCPLWQGSPRDHGVNCHAGIMRLLP